MDKTDSIDILFLTTGVSFGNNLFGFIVFYILIFCFWLRVLN